MNDRSWNNFLAIIATVECVRSATPEGAAPHIHSAHMAWKLTIEPGIGPCWRTVEAGDARLTLGHALAEIERLRERLRAEQDDHAATETRLEVAESALADAGIVRCQGDGCGKYVRAVLMHNDLCDECHATEVSIGNIFGEGELDRSARAALSWRDCLRRGIR